MSSLYVFAAEGTTGGLFNDQAVRDVLLVVAGIVTMVVGSSIISRSKKADYAEVARTSVNSVIGLVIVAMGAGAVGVVAFGQKIAGWLGLA